MPAVIQSPKNATMFSVTTVEKIDAPEGLDGTRYRYVIDRANSSTITGSRRGSMRAVNALAAP